MLNEVKAASASANAAYDALKKLEDEKKSAELGSSSLGAGAW